jgi:RNA polymerase sigma-70 factor (family 1)
MKRSQLFPSNKSNEVEIFESVSFKGTFDKYYVALCFFAERMLQDKPAAEDLVEDVFIKLWEKQPDFGGYKNIKALLYIGVKNACLNFIEKRNNRNLLQDSFSYFLEQESEDFILNEITRAEVLREVYAELQKLPVQRRKVMQLYYIEGWDYQKISEHLNISINTARNHKAKAVRILRRKLGIPFIIFLLFADRL